MVRKVVVRAMVKAMVAATQVTELMAAVPVAIVTVGKVMAEGVMAIVG